MKRAMNVFFFMFIILFAFSTVAAAGDMSDGLQCPSGWKESKPVRSNGLIKQCVSKIDDGVIQLYAKRGKAVPLDVLLDRWSENLVNRGKPYQQLERESPGHVSGYPALLRGYSGSDRQGKWYDSYLVSSRYNGVNYIFIGYTMKGHDKVRTQMRNAMNEWYYPGVEDQPEYQNGNTNNNNYGSSYHTNRPNHNNRHNYNSNGQNSNSQNNKKDKFNRYLLE
ncbi:hypothetical protein [Maridesulfovibrio sp. FT414]|uniref:hypothetical protein n=1 Tax=Maridesulfovibrio sp. FT414 TaxID=2979469 RepID=UPI003D8064E6